jgi:hypothetical protein
MATCLGCKFKLTWEQQRRHFGRLMRLGFTIEQAKAATPRCQKCMTTWLHTQPKRISEPRTA